RGASFADRTAPGVVDDVRSDRRVGVVAGEICRCYEKLKTFSVGSRRTVSLVHVATADPLRARGNSDLVCTVIADRRTGGVRAVSLIVTRDNAVRTAATATGMNRIMPVKVM